LLHVAKWLRSAVCSNNTGLPLPDPSLLKALNLSPLQLTELVSAVDFRLSEVNSLLDINNTKSAPSDSPGAEQDPATRQAVLDFPA